MEIVLRSIDDHKKCLKLNDGSVFILGRNRESLITDIRCSRAQLKLSPNFVAREIEVEHVGSNISAINGVQLKKGEKRKAYHDDIIEVLHSEHKFKLEVNSPQPPDPSYTPGEENSKKMLSNTGSLDHFLKDSALKSVGSWENVKNDSILVFSSHGIKAREKIAAFDMDGTIISTISGNVYPKDMNDWKLAFPSVAERLKTLHEAQYKIVFFTNQGGIGSGKIKVPNFKKKIESIARKIDLPIQVFISGKDDICRKPRPGMWNYLVQKKNDGVEIMVKESFYCGDAAGRPANCEPNKKKKDFSTSDRLYSMNLNLTFYTPEQYFLDWKPAPFNLPDFCPTKVTQSKLLEPKDASLKSTSPEIIILIGCPASGKTFFFKEYLEPEGYIHVNRDTLRTWQKCVKITEQSIKDQLSVVVDNTNTDKETRARYTSIAKEHNVPIRAFYMTTTLDHAKHNNTFRRLTDPSHDVLPNYALSGFSIEPPELNEGFTEIVRVNCVPKFKSEKDRVLYNMYLYD